MIRYSLYCNKDHDFESWFAGSQAFDAQVKQGLVECPYCGSKKVSKALMAPSVSTSRKKEARKDTFRKAQVQQAMIEAQANAPGSSQANVPSGNAGGKGGAVAILDDDQRKLRDSIRELHNKVAENTLDVGDNFAAEARKIHDGDAPQQAIRGKASFGEAKELWEDGIAVLPLPTLPDEQN